MRQGLTWNLVSILVLIINYIEARSVNVDLDTGTTNLITDANGNYVGNSNNKLLKCTGSESSSSALDSLSESIVPIQADDVTTDSVPDFPASSLRLQIDTGPAVNSTATQTVVKHNKNHAFLETSSNLETPEDFNREALIKTTNTSMKTYRMHFAPPLRSLNANILHPPGSPEYLVVLYSPEETCNGVYKREDDSLKDVYQKQDEKNRKEGGMGILNDLIKPEKLYGDLPGKSPKSNDDKHTSLSSTTIVWKLHHSKRDHVNKETTARIHHFFNVLDGWQYLWQRYGNWEEGFKRKKEYENAPTEEERKRMVDRDWHSGMVVLECNEGKTIDVDSMMMEDGGREISSTTSSNSMIMVESKLNSTIMSSSSEEDSNFKAWYAYRSRKKPDDDNDIEDFYQKVHKTRWHDKSRLFKDWTDATTNKKLDKKKSESIEVFPKNETDLDFWVNIWNGFIAPILGFILYLITYFDGRRQRSAVDYWMGPTFCENFWFLLFAGWETCRLIHDFFFN